MSSRQTLEAIRSKGHILVARYSQTNEDGTVSVDFGLGSVSIDSAGLYDPLPGEYVRVLRSPGLALMLGAAAPRGLFAEVVTVFPTAGGGGNLVGVKFSGISDAVVVPFLSTYVPTLGDTVAVLSAYGGLVIGRASTVPGQIFDPPAAAKAVESFTMDFRAIDSGTFDGGWGTFEVWSHVHAVGAWFYGSLISDTIPNAARIDSIKMIAPEFYDAGLGLASVGLHALLEKGTAAPAVFDPVELPAGALFRELPTRYGDKLKTGEFKGIATAHGGFHKFTGRLGEQQSAQSGLLRIRWTV